jgi:hypothetical protein
MKITKIENKTVAVFDIILLICALMKMILNSFRLSARSRIINNNLK